MFVGIDASTAEDAADVAWRLSNRARLDIAEGAELLTSALLDQAETYGAAGHRAMAFGDVVIVMGRGPGGPLRVSYARGHAGWRRLNHVPVHVRGLPPGLSLVGRMTPGRPPVPAA